MDAQRGSTPPSGRIGEHGAAIQTLQKTAFAPYVRNCVVESIAAMREDRLAHLRKLTSTFATAIKGGLDLREYCQGAQLHAGKDLEERHSRPQKSRGGV